MGSSIGLIKHFGVLCMLSSVPVLSGHAQPPSAGADPAPLFTSAAAPGREQKIDAASYGSLNAKMAQQGTVRVIVGLASSREPLPSIRVDERPDSIDWENRRQGIGRLQDHILGQMNPRNVAAITRFSHIPFMALEVDAAALERLLQMPEVTSVREVQRLEPTLQQSIPIIGADLAWTNGFTGQGQTVAILDTGVDKSHSFLAGKVVAEACFSTTLAGQYTSLCPGGAESSTVSGSGANCTGHSDCSHGTHVAGIAAGKSSTSSGVAKDANIIAIQVFSRPVSSGRLSAFDEDLIQALEYAFSLRNLYRIAAVNLSLGGGIYSSSSQCDSAGPAFKAAIDNLRSVGIATVIASGNNSSSTGISYPGCISTAISVGATTDSDTIASFSNSASWLSLLAPGVNIISSRPGGTFASLSGTSMATPHVTGAWALLKQKSPTITVSQALLDLSSTGTPIFDARNGITKPRIRVNTALGASITLSANPAGPQPAGASVTFTAQLSTSSSNYEYQFWKYGISTDFQWVIVRPYSPSNTWTWDSSNDPGVNRFRVWARPIGSTIQYEALDEEGYEIVTSGSSTIVQVPFNDVQADATAVRIRIDAYLPNPGVNKKIIGTVPLTAFTSKGVGLVTQTDYAGQLGLTEYGDMTSYQITSDFVMSGDMLRWRFVDPLDPNRKAAVQKVGFYYGAVDEKITAIFLDRTGAVLGAVVLPPTPLTASLGFQAPSAQIHQIVFSHLGNDLWVVGSFTLSPSATTDITFSGFQVP